MLSLKDSEFEYIAKHIKDNYGVNLTKKKNLIESRLANYVTGLGFDSYMDYFQYAQKEPSRQEMVTMINKLTTNYTYFLRENSHFEFFRDNVLPWVEYELKTKDLCLWSAGCSSGQEPYTLSMFTFEYLGGRSAGWETTILASDISNKVLTIGKEGVYTDEQVAEIPSSWLKAYFQKDVAGAYKVNQRLRDNVAFRNVNLLEPFTFRKKFHAIFCRNVMIYFDNPTKDALINKYYDCLVPGGYLFVGLSESLSTCGHRFQYV
ncbi:MAG: protein-glutamate O-methyltransferase CheR, partial [Anaerovorax sp.]